LARSVRDHLATSVDSDSVTTEALSGLMEVDSVASSLQKNEICSTIYWIC